MVGTHSSVLRIGLLTHPSVDRDQRRYFGQHWFEKVYAPLTAGLLAPFRGDRALAEEKRCTLDRLYQHVCDDLDALLRAVGLKVAA